MILGIGCIMMLPLIAGGVCFILSVNATSDVGKEE
jgi:hypothetical protein